jgi:hypothetical protein
MKKLVLILAVFLGTVSNAQKIEIKSDFFHQVQFDTITEIKSSLLVEPTDLSESTIIPWDVNLIFDLDKNNLQVNEFHFSDNKFNFIKDVKILNIERVDDAIKLTLADGDFWNFCNIYPKSNKIIFFNIETKIEPNFIHSIYAINYSKP